MVGSLELAPGIHHKSWLVGKKSQALEKDLKKAWGSMGIISEPYFSEGQNSVQQNQSEVVCASKHKNPWASAEEV